MQIYVCSNWNQKFLKPFLSHWKGSGHSIRFSLGYDPEFHERSDLTFVDVCDNNAQVASRNDFPGAKLAVRCIDIECWAGQPGAIQWENVDYCIFGAQHIENLVRGYTPFSTSTRVAHIPFPVDMDDWTYRERNPGKVVGVLAHRWSAKGMPLALQIMAKLGPEYKVKFLGTPSNEKWLHYYIDHFIEETGIQAEFVDSVEDVNEWYEGIDYSLVCDQKAAFSYAAAEAAAKGIKPVIHNFWKADDIWPRSWIWNTVDQANDMIKWESYNSSQYREFVTKNYGSEVIMPQIDDFLGVSAK